MRTFYINIEQNRAQKFRQNYLKEHDALVDFKEAKRINAQQIMLLGDYDQKTNKFGDYTPEELAEKIIEKIPENPKYIIRDIYIPPLDAGAVTPLFAQELSYYMETQGLEVQVHAIANPAKNFFTMLGLNQSPSSTLKKIMDEPGNTFTHEVSQATTSVALDRLEIELTKYVNANNPVNYNFIVKFFNLVFDFIYRWIGKPEKQKDVKLVAANTMLQCLKNLDRNDYDNHIDNKIINGALGEGRLGQIINSSGGLDNIFNEVEIKRKEQQKTNKDAQNPFLKKWSTVVTGIGNILSAKPSHSTADKDITIKERKQI